MVIEVKNFSIRQIADSGQCFRMKKIADNKYGVIAYNSYVEVTQIENDKTEFSCKEEEFERIWKDYFDLEYNYSQIVNKIQHGSDEFLKAATEYGGGIRIVKQEPFEAMISFIISQNKNIPAIKNCIEGICKQYGERKVNEECGNIPYYTFPVPEYLANAKKEDLQKLKTGYRDDYIIAASKAVAQGELDFSGLMNQEAKSAILELKKIHGIGEKVANCVALYGLHHIEVFPIDVWIKKVLEEIYENKFELEQYQGYAGIIQQYMFYYMRHLKQK